MQKRALGDQGSFHLQDFLAKRTNGEETAYWIFDELTKLQGKMYGDNVIEKHGINRDRTGGREKTRYLCGKQGISPGTGH